VRERLAEDVRLKAGRSRGLKDRQARLEVRYVIDLLKEMKMIKTNALM
jgi:hypothetical protein